MTPKKKKIIIICVCITVVLGAIGGILGYALSKLKTPTVSINYDLSTNDTIIIDWDDIRGAEGYKVQYRNSPDQSYFIDYNLRELNGKLLPVSYVPISRRAGYFEIRVTAVGKNENKISNEALSVFDIERIALPAAYEVTLNRYIGGALISDTVGEYRYIDPTPVTYLWKGEEKIVNNYQKVTIFRDDLNDKERTLEDIIDIIDSDEPEGAFNLSYVTWDEIETMYENRDDVRVYIRPIISDTFADTVLNSNSSAEELIYNFSDGKWL
ncbi:MAG: hypothetical protein LBN25_01820 [Christensenellaceae bacterium]|jgi:hypothetical protein|nr:hypothetical protein [Christensenellaceae bacterium]